MRVAIPFLRRTCCAACWRRARAPEERCPRHCPVCGRQLTRGTKGTMIAKMNKRRHKRWWRYDTREVKVPIAPAPAKDPRVMFTIVVTLLFAAAAAFNLIWYAVARWLGYEI